MYGIRITMRYDVMCTSIARVDSSCPTFTWHSTPITVCICTIVQLRQLCVPLRTGMRCSTTMAGSIWTQPGAQRTWDDMTATTRQEFSVSNPHQIHSRLPGHVWTWGWHLVGTVLQNLWIWNLRTSWLQKIYHQSWTASTTTTWCHTRLLDSLAGRALLALRQLGSAW